MGLHNARVLVTRPVEQAGAFERALAAHGAVAVPFPLIAIEPVAGEEAAALADAARRLADGAYDAVLYTSANAVEQLAGACGAAGVAVALAAGTVAFAVGKKTAARLAELGVEAVIAERAVAEGLVATVTAHFPDLPGRRILVPRARRGREVLAESLVAAGAAVDPVVAYDTVPIRDGPPLPSPLDWVTFLSPSAVDAFADRTTLPPAVRVACIGPTTGDAARRRGLRVDVEPAEQSVEALVESMARADS